jgi:hypothetical protein
MFAEELVADHFIIPEWNHRTIAQIAAMNKFAVRTTIGHPQGLLTANHIPIRIPGTPNRRIVVARPKLMKENHPAQRATRTSED